MAFLFDTDAISEVLRKRPASLYLEWLRTVPLEDQFTSAVVAAELYKGAFRSDRSRIHLENIEKRVCRTSRSSRSTWPSRASTVRSRRG